MHNYVPIFFNLSQKPCLLIGGGNLAFLKTQALLEAGARIRVSAPELGEGLRALFEAGKITWVPGLFEPSLLEGAFLVVAATDRPELHEQLFQLAEARGQLFNAVDEPGHCNFILPARASSGPIQVAVSSSGTSPTLAGWLRDRIRESLLSPALGELAEYLESWRPEVKKQLGNFEHRKHFWRRVLDSTIPSDLSENRRADADHTLKTLLSQTTSQVA